MAKRHMSNWPGESIGSMPLFNEANWRHAANYV